MLGTLSRLLYCYHYFSQIYFKKHVCILESECLDQMCVCTLSDVISMVDFQTLQQEMEDKFLDGRREEKTKILPAGGNLLWLSIKLSLTISDVPSAWIKVFNKNALHEQIL